MEKIINRLGNIYNENWNTGLPGNVWDKNMCSPTLTTMQGGGRQPHIIVKCLGNLRPNDDNNSQSYRVYSQNGLSPCLGASNFAKDKYVLRKNE